jgi:HAD superfamily hydrolase (TIGR01450 family)
MATDRAELHGPDALRAALEGVRALVLDADGVLLLASRLLPGAADAVAALDAAGFPYRVVTNFSSAHRESLAASMTRRLGLPARADRIITAASAAAAWTRARHPGGSLFVLASADARREWHGQRVLDATEVEASLASGDGVAAVVIGDAGDDLSYRNLDTAFRAVRGGAALVAMHRNMWWLTTRGMTLDAGAFVTGLEAALGRRAVVAGKPSAVVFRAAVAELAADVRAAGGRPLRRGEIAMVGDDLVSDVAGARRVGLRGILVLSGKTSPAEVEAANVAGRLRGVRRPDAVAGGVGEVVAALLEVASSEGGAAEAPR